jgi:hypothetical protein
MKTKLTLAASLAAASVSMAGFPAIMFDPQNPPAGSSSEHKVCAGYSVQETTEGDCTYDDASGFLFDYDDRKNDGGASYVAALGGELDEYESFMATNIAANDYNGVAVQFVTKLQYEYPFAGIGFNLKMISDVKQPVDASSEAGICVVYNADNTFTIEFESSKVTKEAHFMVQVKKGSGTLEIPFDASAAGAPKQPSWAAAQKAESDLATALQGLVAIKFKRGNDDGGPGTTQFQLSQIGSLGSCTAQPFTSSNPVTHPSSGAVLGSVSASAVKAQLSNRTLSFSGLSSVAEVEVINFQGQVVHKAMVNGTKGLSLSNLDNGVYVVRLAGKNLNFSQKIVLK